MKLVTLSEGRGNPKPPLEPNTGRKHDQWARTFGVAGGSGFLRLHDGESRPDLRPAVTVDLAQARHTDSLASVASYERSELVLASQFENGDASPR